MSKPSICCVTPTVRPEQMESFRKAWAPLFDKHQVVLITVWDGENPQVEYRGPDGKAVDYADCQWSISPHKELICRHTDAVRNLGFIEAARFHNGAFDYILTLDDDVAPPAGSDPIQDHLDVLQRRVPISWMNTALDTMADGDVLYAGSDPRNRKTPYLRGFPYSIRDEAPVMVSHGVWVNVPDFDGRTQLELTNNGKNPERLPYSLPYFRGPIPRGVFMPICGMNLMVRKEALPYLYFAPMGPDSGYPDLHRFSDIWMGNLLKVACDHRDWAIYTGASTILHTRASDPHKNVEQERLGIKWNEWMWKTFTEAGVAEVGDYVISWSAKAQRFRDLILKLQGEQ